jgi:hypothetical protein
MATTLSLRNPNGYDGSPGTQYKQGIVRLATDEEVLAGTAKNVVVTVAQLNSVSTGANFASPPILGFGSTTPRPVHATTLDSTGLTSIASGAGAVTNIGNTTGTIGFFGITAAARPGATTDIKDGLALMGLITNGGATPLNLDGGAFTAGTVAAVSTITAGTTLTATLGAITATNGNVVLGTAGNKILSTSVGSSATAGANSFGKVTLIGGTIVVSTTAVTASSIILLTRHTVGATGAAALGMLTIGTIVAGTSFVINAWSSADATALATTDVSNVSWMIIN